MPQRIGLATKIVRARLTSRLPEVVTIQRSPCTARRQARMGSFLTAALADLPEPVWLQAVLLDNPNPQTGVVQSGIYPIFGWKCDAGTIRIPSNGATEVESAYSTARGDTAAQCGDSHNGFSLLWNWNLLGDGPHVVEAHRRWSGVCQCHGHRGDAG